MNKFAGKVYLGADHGGYKLKEKIKKWLKDWGYKFEDCGAFKLEPKDDYPDFAFAVARKVAKQNKAFGILACRSAAGVVIAANKIKGAAAAAAFDIRGAKHMREHNNANILAVSGDWLDEETAKDIIRAFLTTNFSRAKRHIRRLRKIEEIEQYD